MTGAGLGTQEARERLAKYGPNELVAKKGRSPLRMFLEEFRDVFILLLVSATALSAVLGETADATVIGAIVILVALTGFIQEYRAERAIEAMKKIESGITSIFEAESRLPRAVE